ncbi:MAG TPA: vWA domain-containing protein [Planctomycetota bacterium]|nr:vWA domain-containing protein [Planctomycetota bacterium]
MKGSIGMVASAIAAMFFVAGSLPAQGAEAPEHTVQPRVEVAFVLDTTGSMGGLIAGAKEKIWHIANQIVLGKPTPAVSMGLVAYRDKGDEYVTKVFNLTDNIDQVYADLTSFRAQGGGDTPENVNQALHDAVHKLKWSDDSAVLKIIYLVGDCPPHNEYQDVPTYDKTAKAAIEKGININTILCGNNKDAESVWKDVAALADGVFLAIAQDGGVKSIPTPYDKELAELNGKLLDTAVVYGKAGVREKQAELNTSAKSLPTAAAAERSSFAARSGIVARNDLVDDMRNAVVKLENLKPDMLPENVRKMTKDEQTEYLAQKQVERDDLNKQIAEVSKKRNEFVKQQIAEDKTARSGFDQQLLDALKVQAAEKHISYE